MIFLEGESNNIQQLFFQRFLIMCTSEVCVGMCTCVQCPQRPEVGTQSPGAGVSGACEPADIGSGKELSSSGRAVDELNH